MMTDKKYLDRLVGKTVTSTEISTSTTFGISNGNEHKDQGKMELNFQITFEDYHLEIFNRVAISPPDKELSGFIGSKVVVTNETQQKAEISFDNGYRMEIDLRDEAFFGPEAMCLSGPDNFWVVWN